MVTFFLFSHAVNEPLSAQGTEKKIPLLHKSTQVLRVMPLLPPCQNNSSGHLPKFVLHKYQTSFL